MRAAVSVHGGLVGSVERGPEGEAGEFGAGVVVGSVRALVVKAGFGRGGERVWGVGYDIKAKGPGQEIWMK